MMLRKMTGENPISSLEVSAGDQAHGLSAPAADLQL
jgi:hypothetical protein